MHSESPSNPPYHNLPHPNFGEFVGREKELAQIFKLLRPNPISRYHLIVIDGIGGIGKSALALEVAHRCLQASVAAASQSDPTNPSYLTELRQLLISRFSEDELRTLTFDMGVEYDYLPGQGMGGKARELVAFANRRNRIADLIDTIQQTRPDIQIPVFEEESEQEEISAEVFDAIIWTSAKSAVLRAGGIESRRQVIRTLDDIYTDIAITLQQEGIIQAQPELQHKLVHRALAGRRTLLIIDNLETIDDESVLSFLRELPISTKTIVTTRHRIDVAYAIRLEGMRWAEAEKFIQLECEKRGLAFDNEETATLLFERTGGLPLALEWSIAQIALGFGETATLKRLIDPSEDIARFCFKTAVDSLLNTPAYKLLLALSLFEVEGGREALGLIAGIEDETVRDRGLTHLENLSLISKSGGRFRMLPLTRNYLKSEPVWKTELGEQLQTNWLDYLISINALEGHSYWRWINFELLTVEGENILAAVDWALQNGKSETALALAPAIYWYLDAGGRWGKLIQYAHAIIPIAQEMSDYWSLAGTWRQLGWVNGQIGNYEEAAEYLQKGIRACDLIEDGRSDEAGSFTLLAWSQVLRKSGKFEEAAEVLERVRQIAEKQYIADEIPETLEYELGKLARDREDWEAAREHFSRIVQWSTVQEEKKQMFSPDLVAGSRGSLALVLYHLGEYQKAEDECLASMSFFGKSGSRGHHAVLQYRLSLIKEAQGERLTALNLAQSALETCRQVGMKQEILELEALVSRLQSSKDDTQAA